MGDVRVSSSGQWTRDISKVPAKQRLGWPRGQPRLEDLSRQPASTEQSKRDTHFIRGELERGELLQSAVVRRHKEVPPVVRVTPVQ